MQRGDVVASRFEVEDLAGRGAMGVVCRATDRTTGEPVALKLLPAGIRESRRFAREAAVLERVSHPCSVRYLAHGGLPDGSCYLAMEWLEGTDLAERLGTGRPSIRETLQIVRRMAEALAEVHRHGIVHRDVKPSNVFLEGGEASRAKLIDFGLAFRASEGTRLTSSGTILGTPGYMAPEQCRGEREVDARADVYSLGTIWFECLVGKPAFQGAHPVALLAKILLEETPRVSSVLDSVPPALDDLIGRMMAKAPEERPRDGAAVLREIERLPSLDSRKRLPHSSRPPTSLTAAEYRWATVVAMGPAKDDEVVMIAPERLPDDARILRERARAHGARTSVLASGAAVLSFEKGQTASDQAAQAVRCALSLRNTSGPAPLAVATGRSALNARQPVGEAIDQAFALLEIAPSTSVVRIDDTTAGLLPPRFEVRGDAEGLVAVAEHEVVPAPRTLLGKPTRCVGRKKELRMLEAIFEECVEESVARAALLIGPAGIGKSRVRHELAERMGEADPPPTVWLARGDPMRRGSAFGLVGQLLAHACGIGAGEPIEVRRRKVKARIQRHPTLALSTHLSPFLGELVGADFSDTDNVQLRAARHDAVVMGDQIRQAWEALLAAECASGPLVLLVEDLHWGDPPSVNLLDMNLRHLEERPLFILAVARPEVTDSFPDLFRDGLLQEVRIGPLTSRSAEALIRESLGDDLPRRTVDQIVRRSEGNAFYLEELIRAAAGGTAELPGTVLAMVQGRLEALDPLARRALRAGSVFGEVFWGGAVTSLLGGEAIARDVSHVLTTLEAQELVYRLPRTRFAGEEEYGFRHALVLEAAYSSLTDKDRELGHHLAGAWLLAAGETDPAVLAGHFAKGGMPSKARPWWIRAAVRALGGSDLTLALERAAQAEAAGAEGGELGSVRVLQAEAHKWRGEFAEALRDAAEAMELLPRGSADWCRAAAELGAARLRIGPPEALASLAVEVAEVEEVPDLETYAVTLGRLLTALGHVDAPEATAAVRAAFQTRIGDPALIGNPLVQAVAHAVEANQALGRGDLGSFQREQLRAGDLFREAGDRRRAVALESNAGYALIELGAPADAVPVLRAALGSAKRLGLRTQAAAAQHNLGLALVRLGEFAEARELLEAALHASAKQTDYRLESGSAIYLARMELERGESQTALEYARRAVTRASGTDLAPYAHATLAAALLEEGDVAQALTHGERAVALSTSSHHEGLAFVRLTYARCLERAGQRGKAAEVARAARAEVERRAALIDDRKRRDDFLRANPDHARILEMTDAA